MDNQNSSAGTVQNAMTPLRRIVFSAVCAAMCVALPYAFHMIPNFGSIFSPIHIPVLLCGLVCGWQYGFGCGIIGVLLSSILTSMPPMAYVPPMVIECAVYGACAGIGMRVFRTGRTGLDLYLSLVPAMLLGRIVAGACKALIFARGGFTMQIWITSYFVTALPGILVHLVLIPLLYLILMRAKVIQNRY